MTSDFNFFENPDFPNQDMRGLPPVTPDLFRKVNVLRAELKRWITIQSGLHKYYTTKRYHRFIGIVHQELDRIEKECEMLGVPCCYREGERTRTVIFIPGTPEYADAIRRNFMRNKRHHHYCFQPPALNPGKNWIG